MIIYRHSLLLIFLFSIFGSALSSQEIERKIIITQNHFFYTTIDKEMQMATLNVGNIFDPLKTAKGLGMPAGRSYNFPINPFCWDIAKKNVFAINYINNAFNSRNDALKFFPLSGLKEWSESNTIINMIDSSFRNNTFADFEPFDIVTDRSAILENFFFDGVALSDSTVCIVMANKGEISIWNYDAHNWKHSDFIDLPIDNYFSVFTHNDSVYMILSTGKVYSVSTKGIVELPEKAIKYRLSEGTLILDKEKNTVNFIKSINLNFSKPLPDIIKERAIAIF